MYCNILQHTVTHCTTLHHTAAHGNKLQHTATRGIVDFNFSPRNLTQVTSAMKPVQDSMVGFSSVKRITLREGLY